MSNPDEEQNKALVLEAFDALFNRRDYAAAERFWSADYVQHSAIIPPGREGLVAYVKAAPPTMRYEHHVIAASGDYVIVHGRFSGLGSAASIVAANVLRIEAGVFAEHWEVLQDEVTQAQSQSGRPMFGEHFPA